MKGFLGRLFGGGVGPVDQEFELRHTNFNEHVERLRKVRLALQLYSDAVDTLSKAETVLG